MTIPLEFQNVSKSYIVNKQVSGIRSLIPYLYKKFILKSPVKIGKEFWALKDVSFQVHRGETLGIIGPNGAGKSTILKLLSNITYPTKGKIKVNGRLAALIELGAGFHEDLSGRENVYINGAIMGIKRREINKMFDSIADFAGIEDFIDIPIKRYSSGMKARLGFAVLAHMELDILLVDEVLAVGDMAFQKKCNKKIVSFREEGKTIILVSHNLRFVEALCQKTIWLDKGQIVEYGKTKDVIAQYINITNKRLQQGDKEIIMDSDRKGTGDVRITAVKLFNGKGEEIDSFCRETEMRIKIFYKAFRKIKNPDFGISLWTDSGIRISTIKTTQEKCSPPIIEGEGFAECIIPKIPLTASQYFIRVAIFEENEMYPYDFIPTARTFTVNTDKEDGKRYSIDAKWGVIYLDTKWNFQTPNNK